MGRNSNLGWFQSLAFAILMVIIPGGAIWGQTPTPKLTPAPDFKKVFPIFQKSCLPCHDPSVSDSMRINDPKLNTLAHREMWRAQADFQMGSMFPFENDDKPKKQLELLDKELSRNEMPPKTQLKFGLGEPLSEADRKVLRNWIDSMKKNVR